MHVSDWVCVCVCLWAMAGLSVSSPGCSCLLTSLPQDSWEQLHGPRDRDRDRGKFRSSDQTAKPLHLSPTLQFFSPFVPACLCVAIKVFSRTHETETPIQLWGLTHLLPKNEAVGVDFSLKFSPSVVRSANKDYFLLFLSHTHTIANYTARWLYKHTSSDA